MSTSEVGSTLLNTLTKGSFDVGNMAKVLAEADVASQRSIVEKGQTKATTELDALKYLELNLDAFKSYVTDLSSPDLFNNKQVSSSDESVISVSASASASPGSFALESQQLAQSQSQVLEQTFSSQYDTIGSAGQKLNITVGGQVHEIDITASNNTLEGLKETVNAGDFGVTASVINNGGQYQLMFSSKTSGAAGAFSIAADSGTIGGIDTSGNGLVTTVEAQDALVRINGLSVASSTNTFEDLVDGVTVNLQSAKPGETTMINVSQDTENVVETIKTFKDIYNQLGTIFDELGKYDTSDLTEEQLESDEYKFYGDLAGNNILRQVKSEIKASLSGAIDEISGNVNSLAVVGIKFNLDGEMELDETVLNEFAESDLSAFAPLFSQGGFSNDSMIKVLEGSDRTLAGTYDINITQTATRGEVSAANFTTEATGDQQVSGDKLANTDSLLTLEAATFDLTIGAATNSVDLSAIAQTYSSRDEMAAAVERRINETFGITYTGDTPDSPVLATFAYDVGESRFEIKSTTEAASGAIALSNISGLSNQGFSDGGTYASENLIDLTAGTLSFDIKLDDSEVATVNLANGRYTADEFAKLMTNGINTNSVISENGSSVTVASDGSKFDFTSNRFGGFSLVEISAVSADLANAGMGAIDDTNKNGQSVDGTITTDTGVLNIGAYADMKDGRVINISDFAFIGDEEAEVRGLSFQVLGNTTEASPTISFSKGFAARLEETINNYFEADSGLIARRYDFLETRKEEYEERSEKLDLRYEKLEMKYKLQFSALQSILSQAEATRGQLSAQFSNNNS